MDPDQMWKWKQLEVLSQRARGDIRRWKGQPASLCPVMKTCPTVDSVTDGSLVSVDLRLQHF